MTKRTWTVGLAVVLAGSAVARSSHAQLEAGDPAANFTLADWVSGLNNVTDIAWLSDRRAIVLRKQGQIIVVSPDGATVKMAGNIVVDAGSEKGLLGVAVDGQDNIYLYASTGSDFLNKHKVYKARAAADGTVTVDLDNPLVSMGLEGPANHDGGGVVIHEGHLYISVGDTGHNDTPPRNMYGACLNRANGKILRVKLDGTVPADNPLVGVAMATGCMVAVGGMYQMIAPDTRIWTWGFRNPWRFWIDPQTDLLWIGDVGETTQEEITVGGKGANHGWPFNEGTQKYTAPLGGVADCGQMTPASTCVAPVDSYPRNEGTSVTGGLIPPTGCGWGAYESKYFFGDYNSGRIWTLDVKPDRTGAVAGSRKLFAQTGKDSVVSFKMGPDGAMYLASHSQGSVVRLAPKTIPAGCLAAAIPPDAGAGTGGAGGAGAGGAGGGSGGTGAGGSTGGAAGRDAAPSTDTVGPGDADDGGCGCDLGGRAGAGTVSGAAGGLAMVVLAGLLVVRRRRHR